MHWHLIVKLYNVNNNEKMLEASREKIQIIYIRLNRGHLFLLINKKSLDI